MVSCTSGNRMFTFFKSKVGRYMQTEGNILNVHQAASNGDPREVRIESTCTSYLHTQIYFLMHTY